MKSAMITLTFGLALVSAASAARPIVDLGYARYQGVSDPSLGIDYYHGIYYAASPTGSRRWRAPVSIESENDYSPGHLMDASTSGYQCVQGTPTWETSGLTGLYLTPASATVNTTSENCLLLDVIAPSNPVSSALPVIIQIHGGGYVSGNSTSNAGPYFVNYANGGIIYVQIQYRLGAYGFLSSSEVLKDGTANAGLLDQRAAFYWVQRNIAKFGGDPSKVTLWGESAGGGSVIDQLVLYGGESDPPFRAAIAEYPAVQPFHNNTFLEAQYSELLQATECANLACLREVSPTDLANATQAVYDIGYSKGLYGYGDFYFGPSVDGTVIKDLPSNEYKKGHFSHVPLLVDHDGFEGTAFSNLSITTLTQAESDLQTLLPFAKRSFFVRLFELYPLSAYSGSYFDNTFFSTAVALFLDSYVPGLSNDSQFWRLQAIFGDFNFACPTYYVSTALVDAGLPVWKLVFNAGTELHGATSPFLLSPANTTGNATLATYMKDYWLGFITGLDPNTGTSSNASRPYWPQYLSGDSTSFTALIVNQTSMGAQPDPDASPQCDFFHSESDVVRN